MGLLLRNGAEAQTSGTAVTAGGGNTGVGDETAFDEAVIGTNMTLTFDNGHPLTGTNAYKIALTSTATAATYVGWSNAVIGAPVRRMTGGFSYWSNITPSSAIRLVEFFNGATVIGWLGIAGGVQFRSSADAGIGGASAALSPSTLYRVQFDAFFDGTSASGRASTWDVATGLRLAGNCSFGGVAWGTSAGCDHVRFGATTGAFSIVSGDTFSLDDIWISDRPEIVMPPKPIIPKLQGTPVQFSFSSPVYPETPVSGGGTIFNQALAATVTLVAATSKVVNKGLLATVTLTALMSKIVQKSLVAVVTLNALMSKIVNTALLAVVTLTAAMTRASTFGKSMVATVTLTPAFTKTVNKNLVATVTLIAAVTKTVNKALIAVITLTARMTKVFPKALVATVSLVAGIVPTFQAKASAVVKGAKIILNRYGIY